MENPFEGNPDLLAACATCASPRKMDPKSHDRPPEEDRPSQENKNYTSWSNEASGAFFQNDPGTSTSTPFIPSASQRWFPGTREAAGEPRIGPEQGGITTSSQGEWSSSGAHRDTFPMMGDEQDFADEAGDQGISVKPRVILSVSEEDKPQEDIIIPVKSSPSRMTIIIFALVAVVVVSVGGVVFLARRGQGSCGGAPGSEPLDGGATTTSPETTTPAEEFVPTTAETTTEPAEEFVPTTAETTEPAEEFVPTAETTETIEASAVGTSTPPTTGTTHGHGTTTRGTTTTETTHGITLDHPRKDDGMVVLEPSSYDHPVVSSSVGESGVVDEVVSTPNSDRTRPRPPNAAPPVLSRRPATLPIDPLVLPTVHPFPALVSHTGATKSGQSSAESGGVVLGEPFLEHGPTPNPLEQVGLNAEGMAATEQMITAMRSIAGEVLHGWAEACAGSILIRLFVLPRRRGSCHSISPPAISHGAISPGAKP